ncbi:hypothetical protein G4177_36905 [Corallococcus sp. ZKHCc1 1396]|uniref:Uncharacterized protein n=1 Tax=Corallococcus soli TaxID=2710757 RepID=A0ABR9Q0N4_9BACT|nr:MULTISPECIES: hypothetical protein [Corallococcus]MBE4753739.1 hypothetical protein [Corallococcus soli]MCY1035845.1 hypothetical protein [Corallococcus sp. BB11-1]
MRGRQRVKTAVVELEAHEEAAPAQRPATAPPAPPVDVDPLYGVALLKTAFELKRRPDGSVDEVLSAVLARLRIDEGEFRAFLAQQGGLLAALGQKH